MTEPVSAGVKQRTDFGLLWIRIIMGAGIAWHGYGKIFGGGMEHFTSMIESLGFPFAIIFAWMAALSEFGGGLLILVGLRTRIAALLVLVTMAVAAFVAHAQDPLSSKELALAYLAIAGMLVLTGPGGISLDKE